MDKKRLFAFDALRAIAILCILLCHSCFVWNGYEWLGRYFAQTFNLIFLLISAFLIGLKWDHDESPKLKFSFIKQRIRRLAITFYPFLIITLHILHLINHLPSFEIIISQFLFLSWFEPLPYFGQLWYLTMIVICYLLCYCISNFTSIKNVLKGNQGWRALSIVLLIAIACISISTLNGLPGSIFLYAILYSLVFANAKHLISYILKIPLTY